MRHLGETCGRERESLVQPCELLRTADERRSLDGGARRLRTDHAVCRDRLGLSLELQREDGLERVPPAGERPC